MMGGHFVLGSHAAAIFEFGAGVLAVLLVAALLESGITAIRRLLGQ